MDWLTSYSATAALTDKFQTRQDHLLLLAAGLLGEAGSIVAEIKKMNREAAAYPGYRQRLTEELGDFLWYFVRIVALCDQRLLQSLPTAHHPEPTRPADIRPGLDLGSAVGQVLRLVKERQSLELQTALTNVWVNLTAVAAHGGVNLKDACSANLAKTRSRWPPESEKVFHVLFDEGCPVEEQIPRSLAIEFLERRRGSRAEVLLRCNGINVGARVTDNIPETDDYRYHDIFHIAHAVFLGWSPVVRALLRCKRKSDPAVDENQDGARAIILEEAGSASVFACAKHMRFFDAVDQVDYDLLKNIQELVRGYEVDQVPLWQWEIAILEGFRVFRCLRSSLGGRVTWDLDRRTLGWTSLAQPLDARAV